MCNSKKVGLQICLLLYLVPVIPKAYENILMKLFNYSLLFTIMAETLTLWKAPIFSKALFGDAPKQIRG